MPRGSAAGKLWSRTVVSRLHALRPTYRVVDVGPGAGTYAAFREPGQHWIGVEAWEPYVAQFELSGKYDELIICDAREFNWQSIGSIDLVICGNVLEYMTKDDALALLDRALDHARLVLVSIPIVHSPQGQVHGNPFETPVKEDWSHEECLARFPDVCLYEIDSPIGVYLLSRDPQTRTDIRKIKEQFEEQPPGTATRVAQYRDAITKAPHNVQILVEFCFRCAHEALEDVVDVLTWVCGREREALQNRLYQFGLLVLFKEILERRQRGLPLRNALNPRDMHFKFAAAEITRWHALCSAWLERKPNSDGAIRMLIQALVAASDFRAADEQLARLRALGVQDILSAIHFETAFHDTLEAMANSVEGLPPVVVHAAIDDNENWLVFVAADLKYFNTYGHELATSFAQYTDGGTLALHVFDATASETAALVGVLNRVAGLRYGLTTEWTGLRGEQTSDAARAYYHAIRYVRLNELLHARPTATAWILDMDTIFKGPTSALFDIVAGHDVALWLIPSRLDLHNQIAAGVGGYAPTPAGRRYLHRVAGYILRFYRQNRLLWGIDQVALFAVFRVLALEGRAPAVAAVPPSIFDGERGTEGLLWPAKAPDQPSAAAATLAFAR